MFIVLLSCFFHHHPPKTMRSVLARSFERSSNSSSTWLRKWRQQLRDNEGGAGRAVYSANGDNSRTQ